MSYRDALSPWCIVQHLPNMQRSVIARFRKRNDAEAHLSTLKRLNSAMYYEIVFEPPPPHPSHAKDGRGEAFSRISLTNSEKA